MVYRFLCRSAGQLSWYGRTAAPREILLYTSSRTRFLNITSIGERCKHREVFSYLVLNDLNDNERCQKSSRLILSTMNKGLRSPTEQCKVSPSLILVFYVFTLRVASLSSAVPELVLSAVALSVSEKGSMKLRSVKECNESEFTNRTRGIKIQFFQINSRRSSEVTNERRGSKRLDRRERVEPLF